MYWNTILNEVLNKHNHAYAFKFTAMNEYAKKCDEETQQSQKSLPKKQKTDPFSLGEKFPSVFFSPREVECAVLFMQGKTIVQAGQALKLSPRTIEFYLNNMKRKLNCRTKSELICKMLESNLRSKVNDLSKMILTKIIA